EEFVFTGNSGTSTNLFTSAAALGTKKRKFDGDDSLRSRPFKQLLEALSKLGASYHLESPKGDLPFTIWGPLKGGETTVNGISSQFVSSLLFSTPLIDCDGTKINVTNLREVPYIELTMWWLKKQNIEFEYSPDYSNFYVKGRQSYKPFEISVPADFSSATFSAVGCVVTGGKVTLHGLDFSDPQGDKLVFKILENCGANINYEKEVVKIECEKNPKAQVIDLDSIPDALPALSVLGCVCEGETKIINAGHTRIKETDRITVMCKELSKMGASIKDTGDGVLIRKSELHGAKVSGHYDHRVVMALALAGFIAKGETIIETAEAAEVTYPTFVDDFRKLGANISIIEE
ncbi:MAG: 3-phosphoshikimate 1-carboxyvinyltransferase, partial [Chitinispirillaceae bacterium]|nr:3-phosphoshikimate 1-carboxyvinyltransferase [Chitinispirillaceae bacterium]